MLFVWHMVRIRPPHGGGAEGFFGFFGGFCFWFSLSLSLSVENLVFPTPFGHTFVFDVAVCACSASWPCCGGLTAGTPSFVRQSVPYGRMHEWPVVQGMHSWRSPGAENVPNTPDAASSPPFFLFFPPAAAHSAPGGSHDVFLSPPGPHRPHEVR